MRQGVYGVYELPTGVNSRQPRLSVPCAFLLVDFLFTYWVLHWGPGLSHSQKHVGHGDRQAPALTCSTHTHTHTQHKRDTCPDGASPWIVVLLCPWSLLQVRRLTCACALASHMSLQQATIVVCALVLFLAGSSSHIVPHRGSMVIAFSTARRPGDRQAPALTLQHTHTHTHHTLTLPPSCPRSLGTSWVLFQKASCML